MRHVKKKTSENLSNWAIATNPLKPPKTEMSITQQVALKIYALLSDGGYWKTDDIAIALNRKSSHIKSIFRAIKNPWNIESSRSKTSGGYRIST
jgi:hypothetical protein